MRSHRKHERFIRRLETEFSAEGKTYRGISSDLSMTGLFIRTNHAFAPGSMLEITIHLPDDTTSRLKGKVMRAFKTPIVSLKNGMGVYLLEKDAHYISFMKSYFPDEPGEEAPQKTQTRPEPEIKTEKQAEAIHTDFLILACSKCGVKNKVHRSRVSQGPRCGKCGAPLVIPLA